MTFNLNKYLGKWYEIARLRNSFEPNMKNVTAEYNLFENGFIQVINSGYIGDKLRQFVGVARITDQPGLLKVSFFPGIYSDYRVLFIDPEYRYALIGGSSRDFLWILSRTPIIDSIILDKLVSIAKDNGYNTENIILTKQEE